MIKNAFKVILVLVMILGIFFSISNFFPKKVEAKMTEELLKDIGNPEDDLYIWWCEPGGQGCYTVTPDEPV
jgi:hypothetical protein